MTLKDDIEFTVEKRLKFIDVSLSRLEHKAAESADMRDQVKILQQIVERKPDANAVENIRKAMGDFATERNHQNLVQEVA